ncbi:conjugal transfer protein TraF [Geobacter sp. FeAm09]|uniref:conjugal transfer protein TraF n=1 Tax=Geobacter sp. FeAm09 TaxID=2597769 RepID=UPI0011EBC31D|nr:conjugal transfer protein TraF [Geobacter sp. FeAm09]QEM68448.1 conjugal transfer protein TraF [Geobacter sp. FeAm09]
MKKPLLVAAALASTVCSAHGLEFHPIGTAVGMGGAGVANTTGAYAAYWNPAGLAFSKDVSIKLGAGAGAQIGGSLANNVDRLSRLSDPTTGSLDISGGSTTTNLQRVGDAVQVIGLLNEIGNDKKGTLTLGGNAMLGVQIRHFGFGVFGTFEGGALPEPDLTNIAFSGVTSYAALAASIGATGTVTRGTAFFTAAQISAITAAFGGGTSGQDIAYTIEKQLVASNVTNISAQSATDSLVKLGNSMAAGSTAGTLDQNTSAIRSRALALLEYPLAYGYPIDFGYYGTVGIGGAVKLMQGRAYLSTVKIFNSNSSDIVKKMTGTYQDSLTWGVDVGAVWKYKMLNVGVVAKNLNSPSFSMTDLGDSAGYRVRPLVRSGFSAEVLSWLSLAADLDLTKNETALPGVKRQSLGGGLEMTPLDWLKVRLGASTNINGGDTALLTAGFTLGTPVFSFEVDGGASPDSGTYKGNSYPREAMVNFALSSQF